MVQNILAELRVIIHSCSSTHEQVPDRSQACRYACFAGPKGELPKGDDGSYGTSMLLSKAMDPAQDVLIAFKQNGQFLHPDHGFPCRMLIPGWIGGRMVKWLSSVTVTGEESNNWYHYHDNKVRAPPLLPLRESVVTSLGVGLKLAMRAHSCYRLACCTVLQFLVVHCVPLILGQIAQ